MIRFARLEDVPNIMKFIDEHWKKNHILARDENFFKYFCQDEDNVNFIISEDDGDITATLGFIPYAKNNRDVMLIMWKSIKKTDPILGMKLLDYLHKNCNARIVASPGTNPKTTKAIYEYFGYVFDKVVHWYRLNKNCEYKIAVIKDNKILPAKNSAEHLKEFASFDELINCMDMEEYKNSNPKPYKENWYIRKRYFDHPIYKYYAFGVEEDKKVRAVFFYRVQECNNSRVLKLVDCIGDRNEFTKIDGVLDELLQKHNAEYVDIYEVGLEDKIMEQAGFMKVEDTKNIIPNYFAPYEAKNIDIYYCTTDDEIVLFNGDGDQDRPS